MKIVFRAGFLAFFLISDLALTADDQEAKATMQIMGQVQTPGTYHVVISDLNLYALLVRAGGPTQTARWGQGVKIIWMVNGARKEYYHKIEVFDLMKEGPASKLNITVAPDAIVYVMERVF